MGDVEQDRAGLSATEAVALLIPLIGTVLAAQTKLVEWALGELVVTHCERVIISREIGDPIRYDDVRLPGDIWRHYQPQIFQDWATSDFKFKSYSPTSGDQTTRLYGVEFSESDLLRRLALYGQPTVDLGSIDESPIVSTNRRGRPPKPIWDAMWAEISARLIHAEFLASKQSDIENAMLDWFSEQGENVGESTVRERAGTLWKALNVGARKYPK